MKKKLIAASVLSVAALTLGSVTVANAYDGRSDRDKVSTVLGGLVSKGTLTQAQVDAIKKAFDDARGEMRAKIDAERAAHEKVITDALGISAADLATRLKAGDSLATIAGAKKDALITALVAHHTKKINDALAAGKLTAAQAASMKANLKDHVTRMVENSRGTGQGGRDGDGMGPHGKGHHGKGPHGMGHHGKDGKGPKGMGPMGERGPRG